MVPTAPQTDAFYRSAALGLAWLDARESSPRRFGPAADAAWRNYAGQPSVLTDLDRIELLLREAATLHPDAFGARAVFALEGTSEDEPFGQWLHAPTPGLANQLLRTPPSAVTSLRALLESTARAWSLSLDTHAALPPIGPTTRVLCVGASAIVAVAAHFEGDRSLSQHEQVIVLTSNPAVRQLVGLATLALGERSAPRIFDTSTSIEELKRAGVTRLDSIVSFDDASTDERSTAETWLASLGR